MANKIRFNEIYRCDKHRVADNYSWEMIQVNNQDGKDPVTIWIDRELGKIPCGVDVGDSFKVTTITEYSQKKRKNEYNGQTTWVQADSITAIVELVENNLPQFGGDSPFAGSDPFASANPFAGTPFDEKPGDTTLGNLPL